MKLKEFLCLLLAICLSTGLFACSKGENLVPDHKIEGSDLYVKKVENLPEDFIMGMDASCVPALEASGVKYYNFDGQAEGKRTCMPPLERRTYSPGETPDVPQDPCQHWRGILRFRHRLHTRS